MNRSVAPLPKVEISIAARVFSEIDKVDDDHTGLYLEQRLFEIGEENSFVAAVLMIIKKEAQRELGEEAGEAVLRAGVTVYQILKQQTMFNHRKLFLQAKLKESKKGSAVLDPPSL
ncbi:MAG: hypothetical protein HYT13_00555 [Candidatus Liptonbacteria bacterium]|nr:hypothetical protein [Candidatus Liptonbacteria bacterium]